MQNEEDKNLNIMDITDSNSNMFSSNINDPYLDSNPIIGPFQIKNKMVFILMVLILLILGTFLFNKFKIRKLNCNTITEYSGVTTTLNYDFTFSGDKPKKLNMNVKAALNNHIEYKEVILNSFEDIFGDKKDEINKEGGKATISSTDDFVIFEVSAGNDGIDTMLSAGGKSISYDEIKKEFENHGYTCK